MAKDAGMKMSTPYFYGIEANKQLYRISEANGCLGAVAGINLRLTGLTDVKPWEYNAIDYIFLAGPIL